MVHSSPGQKKKLSLLVLESDHGKWSYSTGNPLGWERKEYGFGIPCRYPKAIGKYGFGQGMSVPYYPNIGGIAWYLLIGTKQILIYEYKSQ